MVSSKKKLLRINRHLTLELQNATREIERVESVLKSFLIEDTNLLRMKIGLPSLSILPSSGDIEGMIESTKNLTDRAFVKAILFVVGVACCGIGPYLLFDSGDSSKPPTIAAVVLVICFVVFAIWAMIFRSNPVVREGPTHWCTGGAINIFVAAISLLLSEYFSSEGNAVYGYVLINIAVFAILMLGQPSTDFGILQLCGNLPFLVLIARNRNHFYDGYPVLILVNVVFYISQVYFVRFFNSRFGFRALLMRVAMVEENTV